MNSRCVGNEKKGSMKIEHEERRARKVKHWNDEHEHRKVKHENKIFINNGWSREKEPNILS